jgi:Golgi phosphoprotein 3 (GPP34)
MLMTEELLLLAIDPEGGTIVNGARQNLKPGLVGAAISELALEGRVELRDRRFVATGDAPADPVMRDVHRELARPKGRRAKDQVRRLDRAVGGLLDRTMAGLVDSGVLREERERVLLWPVTRHPVVDPHAHRRLVDRLRDAARGDGVLEPRTAVLLALAGPCRLLEVVAPDRGERAHAKARIKQATDLTPVAPVVKAVIQEAQAAVSAAVIVATTASSGG